MSPLRIEGYNPEKGWIQIGEIGPNSRHGTISDNTPDGKREIYLLRCNSEDYFSEIRKLALGIDTKFGNFRVINFEEYKNSILIKKLELGDTPYEMEVKMDGSLRSRKIRFTHVSSSKQK